PAVGDQTQDLHELLQPRALEDERLAARADGGEDLAQVGRAEDEDEVRRRLLGQLEERVPGGVCELVRLVEDINLVAPLGRLQDDALADLADVVDPALRRRVHLDDVERRAGGDRLARVADLVGGGGGALSAVQRLGENASERGLAGAARPREEVGLPKLVVLDRVPERPHDRLLPDDLVEVLGAVLPVEGGHGVDLSSAPEPPGSGCFSAFNPRYSRGTPDATSACEPVLSVDQFNARGEAKERPRPSRRASKQRLGAGQRSPRAPRPGLVAAPVPTRSVQRPSSRNGRSVTTNAARARSARPSRFSRPQPGNATGPSRGARGKRRTRSPD